MVPVDKYICDACYKYMSLLRVNTHRRRERLFLERELYYETIHNVGSWARPQGQGLIILKLQPHPTYTCINTPRILLPIVTPSPPGLVFPHPH